MARPLATSHVLSLRRLAEAEAHTLLRTARAQLALAQQGLERARWQCSESEKALHLARSAARACLAEGIQPAGQLGQVADGLALRAEKVRACQSAAARAVAEVTAWGQTLELRRTEWLSARARREAAELYESLERREQRRTRAQRERLHEAEAGDRFALFRVK